MRNFLKLGYSFVEGGPFAHYMFCDTQEVLALGVVSDHLVRFEGANILSREHEKYRMIHVKIRLEDEEGFEAAMGEFADMMMFKGYRDYGRRALWLIADLERAFRMDWLANGVVFAPDGEMVYPEKVG